MTVQAIAGFQGDDSGFRRGACPTLGRPMRTGDGLLARLRPENCRLTVSQIKAVALAAAEHGNGILEVTARGSLQIRGLRPETVAPFEQAVLAAGVIPASGVMAEVPPLAGIDPGELMDPRVIAQAIRLAIAEHEPPLVLAPKLAITVDGGGRFHLGAVTADVRLTAIDDEHFLLALGGTNHSARRVAVVERALAASAVLQVVQAIAALGPAVRGKDVGVEMLGGLHAPAASDIELRTDVQSFLGIQELDASRERVLHPLSPLVGKMSGRTEGGMVGQPTIILGIGLPYRQVRGDDVIAFLDEIEILGISDTRLSPGHGIILVDLDHDQAARADEAARRHGFWTSPDEPRANISLCAGTTGCASAHYDTRGMAEDLAGRIPALLDGSITLHLSGCPKGCAHPSPAGLTLTGAPSGYGLVVNGAASDMPALYIAAKDLGIALERLASLAAGAKEAGETMSGCLERLGPTRIAAALKLDGQ